MGSRNICESAYYGENVVDFFGISLFIGCVNLEFWIDSQVGIRIYQ